MTHADPITERPSPERPSPERPSPERPGTGEADEPCGEAACVLHRVCDACGALEDGPPAPVCGRCGAVRDG